MKGKTFLAYRIGYNDFGDMIVVAKNAEEAIKKFREAYKKQTNEEANIIHVELIGKAII